MQRCMCPPSGILLGTVFVSRRCLLLRYIALYTAALLTTLAHSGSVPNESHAPPAGPRVLRGEYVFMASCGAAKGIRIRIFRLVYPVYDTKAYIRKVIVFTEQAKLEWNTRSVSFAPRISHVGRGLTFTRYSFSPKLSCTCQSASCYPTYLHCSHCCNTVGR